MEVKSLKISDDRTKIEGELIISSPSVSKVLYFDIDTYDKSSGKEVSNTITTISGQNKKFELDKSKVSKENFFGFHIIKFELSDNTSKFYSVSNYTKYYECVLSRLIKLQGEKFNSNQSGIFYLDSTLRSLNISTSFGKDYFKQTIKIVKELDKLCLNCKNCPDYSNLSTSINLGYKIVDDKIVSLS